MCGVAGWVDLDGLDPRASDVAARMNAVLEHRGPDESGTWVGPRAALAHRRLSVLDVENGAQPMVRPDAPGDDARLVLSYNGEIYNFRALREELAARGHAFGTSSDTEVLLHAWAEWGPAAVERLDGIFAFAVWDTVEETLWLVRDRLGVKPLHFHLEGRRLVFGSEAKAVLLHPDIDTVIDHDGLRHLLLPLFKVPGASPYRGLRELEPGQVLRFSHDGIEVRRYWDAWEVVGRPAATKDPLEASTLLAGLLQETVERQTVADVPLCTFLSGGLDSSVITALAGRQRGTAGLRSFSVDFDDLSRSHDTRSAQDRRHARLAAEHIGTEHQNVVLSSADLGRRDVRDAAVRARDLPSAFGDLDPSLLLLCREVARHATVALSGEAADEILGGYRWFDDPDAVWSGTFPWMADTPAHGHLHQRVLATLRPDLVRRLELEAFVRDQHASAVGRLDTDPEVGPADRRHREIVGLALTYFLPMLLDRNDRLSMASGLEVRVPFCDHRIVELVASLPRDVHNAGGRGKGVLRDATGPLLPASVRERVKSPYPTTPDPQYSSVLAAEITETLAAPRDELRAIFDDRVLDPAHLTDAARSRGLVSNLEGEVLLNVDSWLRQYSPRLVA